MLRAIIALTILLILNLTDLNRQIADLKAEIEDLEMQLDISEDE